MFVIVGTVFLLLANEPPCQHPALARLPPASQAAGCALLQETPVAVSAPNRVLLSEIYQRPALATARAPDAGALRTWVSRGWIWLERFFESSGAERFSNITRFGVLALACAVALLATLRALSWRRRRGSTHRAAAKPESTLATTPGTHLGRAGEQLGTDPREALRESLLALLCFLERARLARPDRVKTNSELARELSLRGASRELGLRVSAALSWYDRTYYSLEPVTEPDARRFLEDVAGLGHHLEGGGR